MTNAFNHIRDLTNYLDELAGTITIENGYLTDMGLAHYNGRRSLTAENAPCVTLIEGPDEVPEQGPNSARIKQRYGFSAFVPCDTDNPNAAGHDAFEDILKAVFGQGRYLGGRVKEIAYVGHSMAPRQEGDNVIQVVVEVDVVISLSFTRN
jgi:hypothetical protein